MDFIVWDALSLTILVIITLIWAPLWGAVFGAIYLLIGNAILRNTDPFHYGSDHEAAAIGSTGGAIVASIQIVVAVLCALWDVWWLNLAWGFFTPFYSALDSIITGVLAGVIGSAVLWDHGYPLTLDTLHAARAGAVGGAVVAAFWLFIGLMVLLVYLAAVGSTDAFVPGSGLDGAMGHCRVRWVPPTKRREPEGHERMPA